MKNRLDGAIVVSIPISPSEKVSAIGDFHHLFRVVDGRRLENIRLLLRQLSFLLILELPLHGCIFLKKTYEQVADLAFCIRLSAQFLLAGRKID
ncbi:MAG: hypothetical protein IPN22_11120 [Bacteroidetes bacterium]|nr:hypothetical protein [Bacteroidota bacterium]